MQFLFNHKPRTRCDPSAVHPVLDCSTVPPFPLAVSATHCGLPRRGYIPTMLAIRSAQPESNHCRAALPDPVFDDSQMPGRSTPKSPKPLPVQEDPVSHVELQARPKGERTRGQLPLPRRADGLPRRGLRKGPEVALSCTCAYTHICICTCKSICMYITIYIYVCICMYINMHACMHVFMYLYLYLYLYLHLNVYYLCIHIYI